MKFFISCFVHDFQTKTFRNFDRVKDKGKATLFGKISTTLNICLIICYDKLPSYINNLKYITRR